MTKDLNKNIIDIKYNYCNLPISINKGENRIEYDYNADGNKLCANYIVDGLLIKTTDFIGNFVYEDGAPVFWVIHEEGRVVFDEKGGIFPEYI